jgi:hypothetical protein
MQRYTAYLYLETTLHGSGGTSTHHQERIQLYLQQLVFVTPLLLSAAIVEELETGVNVLWVAYATHSTFTLTHFHVVPASKQSANLYDINLMLCVQS